MRDELESVLVNVPKPRGEGAWAWVGYHLRILHNFCGSPGICVEVGCPARTLTHNNPRCPRHTEEFYAHPSWAKIPAE